MKKRNLLIVCLGLGIGITVQAYSFGKISAQKQAQNISYQGNTTRQEVIVYNNTTYVPLRDFSNLVGTPVEYKNRTIYLGNNTNAQEVINNSTSNHQNAITNNSSASQDATATSYIGEAKAKAIALQHAGVHESDIMLTKLKLDYDDRKAVYEVEFYIANKEYDYKIDAKTGKIVSYDYDVEGFTIPNINNSGSNNAGTSNNGTTNQKNYIGKDKALEIALNHAGLTSSQVKYVQNKLEFDDGRRAYQIEFRSGSLEYEYEIDAYTGAIIKAEKDVD